MAWPPWKAPASTTRRPQKRPPGTPATRSPSSAAAGGETRAGRPGLPGPAPPRGFSRLARCDDRAATMSGYLSDQLPRHPNTEILARTEVAALPGEGELRGLTVADRRDGTRR